MLTVTKFGGSSLSCATQFAKVKKIIESDPKRKIVVRTAPTIETTTEVGRNPPEYRLSIQHFQGGESQGHRRAGRARFRRRYRR